MSEEYKVGYGKPPVHTRFQKGQSGNRKGRPKRSRLTIADIDAAFDRALVARVNVAENGKVRTIRKLDALATQTVNKGVKGHHPTSSMILSHYQKRAAAEAEADEYQTGPTSEESIAEIDVILNEVAGNLSAHSDASVRQSGPVTDAEPAQASDSASAKKAPCSAIDAS